MKKILYILLIVLVSQMSYSQNRVVGGTDADKELYPWMVSFVIDDTVQGCAGTLVASRWVLTASICVRGHYVDMGGYINTQVILNSSSGDLDHLDPQARLLEIDTIIPYPGFNFLTLQGTNLCLVRLVQDVNIEPVALLDNENLLFTGADAHVLGWGMIDENEVNSEILQVADVEIFDFDTCQQMYVEAGPMGIINLVGNEEIICAGYFEGKEAAGAANGDCGGALIINDSGVNKQAGIVLGGAMGGNFTTDEYPGIFTLTTSYIPWIESIIASFGDEMPEANMPENLILQNTEVLEDKIDVDCYILDNEMVIDVKGLNSVLVIELIDISGKVNYITRSSEKTINIPTGSLSKGLYFVKIRTQDNKIYKTLKVVI